MYDLSSLYRSCLKLFVSPLRSRPFCPSPPDLPPPAPLPSLNHLFFFLQQLLLQLLLPTFEVTSRPFRPSVTSPVIQTDRSREDIFTSAREEERESRRRALESSSVFLLFFSCTSVHREHSRRIKRMTNAGKYTHTHARTHTHTAARNPRSFAKFHCCAIIIKPPVHKCGKKNVCVPAIFARVYQTGSEYAPFAFRIRNFILAPLKPLLKYARCADERFTVMYVCV